ncbi:MAG: glycerol-3-phosphate dehydrogenase/oxidase [Acidobacteriia bacterium]|nr:glycerol-3-phosphate dehydrogenase/oxidase [Terriglobia bacterium]
MTAVAPAFHLLSRKENLALLASGPLDVLIVGGGINGAGIVRDLALRKLNAGRRLRIGLIEKRHFASGTSGRNSQLIHGGLRYLEQFDFGLVREALRERALLVKLAPHLVEPLGFLIPFTSWFERCYYGLGLWLYDLLAGSRTIGRRRYFSREELARLEPGLASASMHSAAIYFDCRVNSARLLLENIFDAARHGAIIANYAEATQWVREGDGFDVRVKDSLDGSQFTIRARRIVDARGPWEGGGNLRLVRGSHVVLPALTRSGHAIAHFHTDGRIIFVIPWGPDNRLSLVGTTDVDHPGSPDEVGISPEEIRYLLGIVRQLFPSAKDLEPVAVFSSLRPLLAAPGASASKTSRTHKIRMEDGVVKITGGKYTTYRAMSAEAVDLLMQDMAPDLVGRCPTAEAPFPDSPRPATREAIIAIAVEHEMAVRLADLMFVSTYWGYHSRWDAASLRPIAQQMQERLGWTGERLEQEIALVLRIGAIPKY